MDPFQLRWRLGSKMGAAAAVPVGLLLAAAAVAGLAYLEAGQSGPAMLALVATILALAAALVGIPLALAVAVRAGRRSRAVVQAVDEIGFSVRAGDPPRQLERPAGGDEIAYLAFSVANLALSLRDSATRAQHLASELEIAASRDALTGALSRQHFQRTLEDELTRAGRYKGPLSLAIMNVDQLTSINEKFGADAGDAVLATIANLVRFNIRKTDRFVRWGGGEFLLLVTETRLDGARALAEKLRSSIQVHPFERVGPVTMSLGVTELADGDTRDTFVRRADDAVRRAKARGRNRVVAAAAPHADRE
jgi:diguanylate cyclase (GGDEF)-like protein